MGKVARIQKSNKIKPYSKYANLAAGVAGIAAKVAERYANSATGTGSSNGTTGTGVTTQNDAKVVYKNRTKKLSRKAKAKVTFARKVKAVMQSKQAPQTVLVNNTMSSAATAAPQQYREAHLGGWHGTGDGASISGCADLFYTFDGNPDVTADKQGKIEIHTAHFDATFSSPTDNTKTLEIDVYEVVHRKFDLRSNLLSVYADADNETLKIDPSKSSISIFSRGATPFDFPVAAKNGHIVMKKTKYLLTGGQAFTYQMSIQKRKTISYEQMKVQEQSSFFWPNYTRSLFILTKATDGSNITGAELVVACTRKYKYALIPLEESNAQDNIVP